jgi:hypothetical protein
VTARGGMKTIALLGAALLVSPLSCHAPPARTVVNNVLSSADLPRITVEFDKEFTYLGSQAFDLADGTGIEQHFFVIDENGMVRRMYRVQFASLAGDSPYAFNHAGEPAVRIAGREFFHGAAFAQTPDVVPEDGSDQSRADAFLLDRGYDYAREGMSQRLEWPWDESARRELTIVYSEDLGADGYEAADFQPGGRMFDRRDSVSAELLGRALAGMRFEGQASYPGE